MIPTDNAPRQLSVRAVTVPQHRGGCVGLGSASDLERGR